MAVHRAIEAAASSPSYKRLQHDIPTLLWRKGCNKVARRGSFCPPEELFQLPLVGARARCVRARARLCAPRVTLEPSAPRLQE